VDIRVLVRMPLLAQRSICFLNIAIRGCLTDPEKRVIVFSTRHRDEHMQPNCGEQPAHIELYTRCSLWTDSDVQQSWHPQAKRGKVTVCRGRDRTREYKLELLASARDMN